MKNQNKTEIRLSVKDGWLIVGKLQYERATCVQQLATCRQLAIDGSTWEREIAETDALIATIRTQL